MISVFSMFDDIVEFRHRLLTVDGSTTLALVANNSTHGGSCLLETAGWVYAEGPSMSVTVFVGRRDGGGNFTWLEPLGVLSRRLRLQAPR